jgi:hypothetical protein
MAISPARRGISLILPRVKARGGLIAAYRQVRLTSHDCLPDRQVKSAAGAPVNGISQAQLASACLREAASAKAGPFLSNLGKMIFSAAFSAKIRDFSVKARTT